MPVTRRKAASEAVEFVYQALDLSVATSFRLVILHPGVLSSPLSCTLSREDWDQPDSSYEAVSYFWGSPLRTRRIEIDGATLAITANLESALRHLRDKVKPRRLWVDAICINQAEQDERSQQVRQMFNIYQNASQVIVWLGDATPGSNRAMSFINSKLGPCLESAGFSCSDEQANIVSGFWDEWDEGKDAECWEAIDSLIRPKHVDDWSGIAELLCRPWFSRSWTVQELLSAKGVSVVSGILSVPWPLFDMTIQMMLRNTDIENLYGKSKRELYHNAVEDAYAFAYERSHRVLDGANAVDFVMLTQITRYRGCRDARDKVFSIVSLLSMELQKLLDIDYLRPVVEVYSKAVISYIEWSGNLHILSSCCLTGDAQPSIPNLPSWIPDWGKPFEMSYLAGYSSEDLDYSFRASADEPMKVEISDDSRSILVSGIEIDTVSRNRLQNTDEEFEFEYDEAQPHIPPSCVWDIQKILAELEECHKKTPIKTRYREPDIKKAFFSTLVVDRDPISSKRRPKMRLKRVPGSKSVKPTSPREKGDLWPQPLDDYLAHVRLWSQERTLVLSEKGYLGLAPVSTLPGDKICVLFGLHAPAILRPISKSRGLGATNGADGYTLIGDAYVHALMDGEAVEGLRKRKLGQDDCLFRRTFTIK